MRNWREDEDDDDDDYDEFYESRSRNLSACSSTSCSDDEGSISSSRRHLLRFPPPSAISYDLWLSDTSPIQDRRRRLLQQFEIIADPPLSPTRARSASAPDESKNLEIGNELTELSESRVDLGLKSKKKEEEEWFESIKRFNSNGRNLEIGDELTVPIVQELMRRQNIEESRGFLDQNGGGFSEPRVVNFDDSELRGTKKEGWIESVKRFVKKLVACGSYNGEDGVERVVSLERGRRSSSVSVDSRYGGRVRVRESGKSVMDFTGVYLTQEIEAHSGAIWCVKFSLDGRYMASAGEDCVIHVWKVTESEKEGMVIGEENGNYDSVRSEGENGGLELELMVGYGEGSGGWERRRRRMSLGRKLLSSDQLLMPDQLFAFQEKPVCSFKGHGDDVLDLSWSKSEYLLSSSMDKTVRLWHMSGHSCLKTFTHSDYVTCIQFNPVDDRYFISGSLDAKVRIWSIPDRKIVNWIDLHGMVTAACYTPDGQGAFVGSHKGSCHIFDTSDNKLFKKSQIDFQKKKKNSNQKKITGFQFTPGSSSEVLITSADSTIRVVDDTKVVHKFKGFRNTNSQISASLATNRKYVVCASEDSHVYIWKYDANTQPDRSKETVPVTQSYEHFHCRDVTVAVPWPSTSISTGAQCGGSPQQNSIPNNKSSDPFGDRLKAWTIDKQSSPRQSLDNLGSWKALQFRSSPRRSLDNFGSGKSFQLRSDSAWGMVIVTAGRGGQIRAFQNFGFPC